MFFDEIGYEDCSTSTNSDSTVNQHIIIGVNLLDELKSLIKNG